MPPSPLPSTCYYLTNIAAQRACAVQKELSEASTGTIIGFVLSLLMLVLGGICSLSERNSDESVTSPRIRSPSIDRETASREAAMEEGKTKTDAGTSADIVDSLADKNAAVARP